MLKVKLVRKGKKNLPSFRVEVTEGSKTVALIGSYYPHSAKSQFSVSKEKLEHWLKVGAKLTPAVEELLKGKYKFKPYVRHEGEEAAAETAPSAPAAAPEAPALVEEAAPEVEKEAESSAPEEVPPAAPETPAPESSPEEKKEVESAPEDVAKPNA